MKISITKEVIHTARQCQLCVGGKMEKYGITAAEEPFFMAIQKHVGATQDELTALVGVDKAATTRALSSLERKGYLIRQQDESDRRKNRIYATDQALKLGPEVLETLLELNDEILHGISEEDQEILCHALLQMERNLKNIKEREKRE